MEAEKILNELTSIITSIVSKEAKANNVTEQKISLLLYADERKEVKIKVLSEFKAIKILELSNAIGVIRNALFGNTIKEFIVNQLEKISKELDKPKVNGLFSVEKNKEIRLWVYSNNAPIKQLSLNDFIKT